MIFVYRTNGGEVESIEKSEDSYLDIKDIFLSGVTDPVLPDGPRPDPPKIFIAPNTIRNATPAEISNFLLARNQDENLKARVDAKKLLSQDLMFRKILKSFLYVLMNEINTLRQQHGLSERTLSQLRTAIVSRIDSGDSD